MVDVLNPLFLCCRKIGKREAGKFERAHGLNDLASVNRVPCSICIIDRIQMVLNLNKRKWRSYLHRDGPNSSKLLRGWASGAKADATDNDKNLKANTKRSECIV